MLGLVATRYVLDGRMTVPYPFYIFLVVLFQVNPGSFRQSSATEFLFMLAVPRRLPFRIKIASSLAILAMAIVIPVLLVLPVALSSSSEISAYLPHSAAKVAQLHKTPVDQDEEWRRSLDDRSHNLMSGFALVPREAYDLYTVPRGRIARLLGFGGFVLVVYLVIWLVYAPIIMRWRKVGPGERRVRANSTLLMLLMFFCFFCAGPVDAWVFVLAYTHPLYLIGATVAICVLLLGLAERQFVNLEVGS